MAFLHFMTSPVGRVIRIVAGLVLIGIGAKLGGLWFLLAVFGLVALLTGILGICPICMAMGKSAKCDCKNGGRSCCGDTSEKGLPGSSSESGKSCCSDK